MFSKTFLHLLLYFARDCSFVHQFLGITTGSIVFASLDIGALVRFWKSVFRTKLLLTVSAVSDYFHDSVIASSYCECAFGNLLFRCFHVVFVGKSHIVLDQSNPLYTPNKLLIIICLMISK